MRSGKRPFDALGVEEALHRDVIATNSGNLIFSDATHKILETPGAEVVSNGMKSDVGAASRINEEYDVFVVPLANAFRPSFELPLQRLTRLINKLKIPVVVVGVGAQTGVTYDPARLKAMEPSVRAFCSAVLDHSASIGVRGEFTEKYLNDMGFRDVEVIGCPSMFMHGDRLPVEKRTAALTADSRVAVNGSHTAVRGGGLSKIIDRAHEQYPNLMYIGQNLTDAKQLHWRDVNSPAGRITEMPTHPDHPMYREGKARVYVDPVTWIDDLRDFDYSFGSRIHGNIAALLAGTPATVLAFDSRTLELCRYFEIPHRLLSEAPADLDPAQLYEEADFGPLTGNHRQRFDRFTTFLDKNGLENTFTHGDGGAAFEKKLRSLSFPAGVRPWNDADLASLTSRFGWLQQRITELDSHNTQLQRDLAKARSGAKAAKAALPSPSIYRRARRAVGRPLRQALKSK
ncbi:polysaccharide pyruvyl transferase family protein [Streptomyces sp. NPDC059378]|uniref:polysaccharide pyruvyl transferase family protein n=1 Tax=Streptomyces sp. NPDC059378 TaxID=3346815 RepID=UPI00369FA63C